MEKSWALLHCSSKHAGLPTIAILAKNNCFPLFVKFQILICFKAFQYNPQTTDCMLLWVCFLLPRVVLKTNKKIPNYSPLSFLMVPLGQPVNRHPEQGSSWVKQSQFWKAYFGENPSDALQVHPTSTSAVAAWHSDWPYSGLHGALWW